MLLHKRFELADEGGVPADREIGLDPVLDRRQPQLIEPRDLVLRKTLVSEVRERRPAPESKSVAQPFCASLVDELVEALEIELARFDAKQIARGLGLDPPSTELLPQLGYVDLQSLLGRLRRLFPPERVD